MFKTIIWRHRKENLKKCSLKNLNKNNFIFLTYPKDLICNLSNYIIITINAPKILSIEDRDKGLFFIDSTWKYANVMQKKLPLNATFRSLPKFQTAYPRKQTLCPFPQEGLATLEAIYIAYLITQRNTQNILDNYYFKNEFLKKNNLTERL